MTDLERLRELLDSWGVPYREDDWEQAPMPEGSIYADRPWHPKLHSLEVGRRGYKNSESDKIDGYTGFFTSFEFTPEGEFVRMGAWE